MKRAILVTTSTVVGVAAVLGYKPNSDAAQTLLDITGANNTASTTQTTPTEAAAPTPSAEPTQQAAATPSATTTASATPSATSKPTPSASASAKPTATASKTPAPAPTTKATGTSKTITGDTAQAISHGKDYGTVTVTVTLVDGKMTKISATQNPEGRNYPYIQAVRQYLIPAVLEAQQVNVGYVQGATGSSEAFIASLQSALNKA